MIFHLCYFFSQDSILIPFFNQCIAESYNCFIFSSYFIFESCLIILKLGYQLIPLVNRSILKEFWISQTINRELQFGYLPFQWLLRVLHSCNFNISLPNFCLFSEHQSLVLSFSLLVRLHCHCNTLSYLLKGSYLLIFVCEVPIFLLHFKSQLGTDITRRITLLIIWLLILHRLWL